MFPASIAIAHSGGNINVFVHGHTAVTRAHTYAHRHTDTHTDTHAHRHRHRHIHRHTRTQTHRHTHRHTYIHTHTHTTDLKLLGTVLKQDSDKPHCVEAHVKVIFH